MMQHEHIQISMGGRDSTLVMVALLLLLDDEERSLYELNQNFQPA